MASTFLRHFGFSWVIVAAACGASSGGGMPVTQQVGPQGGTVSAGDGIEVAIPAGALATTIEVEALSRATTAISATPPAGQKATGLAAIFRPHGQTFDIPITITLPAPADATSVLRLDDETDTTWEVVRGATFADGRATFSTSTFSVYAVAVTDPSVPPARGIINPPEIIGGGIPGGHDRGDPWLGLSYWTGSYGGTLHRLIRSEIGGAPEVVLEIAEDIWLMGVGADAVYFYRVDAGSIARLTHDLTDLNLDWAKVPANRADFVTPGFVGTRHFYSTYYRIELETGVVQPTPYDGFGVEYGCALNPDRTLAACTTAVFKLLEDTFVRPRYGGSYDLSNGQHAANDTAFFFTPQQISGGPVYRLDYAALDRPVLLKQMPAEVLSAAASNDRLYLGLATTIVALDTTTGATVGTISIDDPANANMYVWKGFLYYGVGGLNLKSVALSAFEP